MLWSIGKQYGPVLSREGATDRRQRGIAVLPQDMDVH
jgi:hypothetical protein